MQSKTQSNFCCNQNLSNRLRVGRSTLIVGRRGRSAEIVF